MMLNEMLTTVITKTIGKRVSMGEGANFPEPRQKFQRLAKFVLISKNLLKNVSSKGERGPVSFLNLNPIKIRLKSNRKIKINMVS